MIRKSKLCLKLIPLLGVFFVFFLGPSVSLAAHHEERKTNASDVKKEALETYDSFKKYNS